MLLFLFLMQSAATMEIQKERERLDNLQQIHEVVQVFCEEQKTSFLTTLQQNIQTQFPSVTGEEVEVLLYKHSTTYGNGLVNSFQQKLYQNLETMKERLPERVKEVMKMDMRREDNKLRKEYATYQEAMQIPKDFTNPATLHKMLFPKKNTLLALQVINRLAREYEIRFEDVETVLKECLVV